MFKTLLASGLVRARVQKALRVASGVAGTWVLTSTYVWLTLHVKSVSTTDAATIAGILSTAVGGLIMVGGSAFYGIIVDTKIVDAKITTAAATGSIAAANDPAVRAQVATAITATSGNPDALKQVLATLKSGGE